MTPTAVEITRKIDSIAIVDAAVVGASSSAFIRRRDTSKPTVKCNRYIEYDALPNTASTGR
jgi:hypothetical protein